MVNKFVDNFFPCPWVHYPRLPLDCRQVAVRSPLGRRLVAVLSLLCCHFVADQSPHNYRLYHRKCPWAVFNKQGTDIITLSQTASRHFQNHGHFQALCSGLLSSVCTDFPGKRRPEIRREDLPALESVLNQSEFFAQDPDQAYQFIGRVHAYLSLGNPRERILRSFEVFWVILVHFGYFWGIIRFGYFGVQLGGLANAGGLNLLPRIHSIYRQA